jgi:hypothetical protein
MGRRKPRNIKIREDRLESLSTEKLEVAIWLLARGTVEDRTERSQPASPASDGVNIPGNEVDTGERPDTQEAA